MSTWTVTRSTPRRVDPVSPSVCLDASVSASRYAARGLGLGVAWGVAARGWMRLIAPAPDFTWRGSLSIVVAAAVAGSLLGAVRAAGLRGETRAWRGLALPAVALFLGPGLVFLPAFVLGGWGLRRGPFGRAFGLVAVGSAPVLLVETMWDHLDRTLLPFPEPVYVGLVVLGAAALSLATAWAGTMAWGPWRSRRAVRAAELRSRRTHTG